MQRSIFHAEIAPLRQASRQLVRELGFLEEPMRDVGITHSQSHVLIELDRQGRLTSGELSIILNLDKSTMSRVIAQLQRLGYVAAQPDGDDKRRRLLRLTPKGQRKLAQVHATAESRVEQALSLLEPPERRTVVDGLSLYARALSRSRSQAKLTLRPITRKDDRVVAAIIRTVMPEFGASGPGFAISDPEVDAMSIAYGQPRAGYFVIADDKRVLGGGGFAQLTGGDKDVCELRKMYFLPELRGAGMGRKLLLRILEEAKAKRYRLCYLETLKSMVQARSLYESVGFERISRPMGDTGHFSCDAWYTKKL